MSSDSATRASLLLRIRDPRDTIAWSEFVELYAPLIHAYGLRRGLQDADAADLAQNVLRCVMRSVAAFHYDPARGSFRGWLLQITRNELCKLCNRQSRQTAGTGDTQIQRALAERPDPVGEEDAWDHDYQWNLFQWAANRVRAEFRAATWQAFWLTAVSGREAAQVAAELGISVGAVYIARSRVTTRIRQQIHLIEST
jgi:RNA polymerase sigma-70 factor (ECF subfamily)